MEADIPWGRVIVVVVIIPFLLTLGFCGAAPRWGVYQAEMAGLGRLKEAEYGRRALVSEAIAKRDAAKELAAAEVARARGVAEANRIIGQSLHNNESYLRYLWIHNLESEGNRVIYIPTEANLPILEAHRLEEP